MFEYKEGCLYWKIDRFAGLGLHLRPTKGGDKLKTACNKLGYHTFVLEGEYISAHLLHRVIYELVTGEDITGLEIDHIDGNPRNNLIENLRAVKPEVNSKNARMNNRNKSGCAGVCYDKTVLSYKCYWRKTDGSNGQKTFTVNKYGEEEAFRLACEYRKKMIEKLNEELGDEGYTERHGQKMEDEDK